ncbi:DNA polymerase III subunit delta [Pseudoruminococcus massiliensis]|uniref:DNA polymerase III subunit delta n=1 Tax=Pseudoruminococcus massiliensis TaxID=2086583 RepID=UPI0039958BB1
MTSDSKKTNKTKKFSTMAEKVGTVLHCEKRGEIALERNIISWAKKLGCEIDEINAAKLVASCGTDMNTLENETQKLCAYVGSGIITDDAIKAVAVKNTEARIFALSDSIIRRDYNSAYKQLDLLFYQREKPEVILGVLSSAFVDIYRVRTAIESGEKASVLKDIFPYKGKEFRLRNAERDMKQYSNKAISKILDAIAYADIRLKSNVGNQRTVLEMLIAKILLIVKEDSGK